LPSQFTNAIEVVQFSSMTRKRSLFPLYGMQWGPNVYLYPIEASLQETYRRPPTSQQQIEARMYGGEWTESRGVWTLTWTRQSIKDFYLHNVLIHEIGHVNDQRNTNSVARERYANWFATEYGYRKWRGRF
jgi:Mlc titration factor MtfA (ptsG expression regulator)